MTDAGSLADLSARLVGGLTERGETVACAESLTAGLVCAAIADTPGASAVLRGGVIAYAADVKVGALGVPSALVDEVGTVDTRVAAAMAEGIRTRLGATWGVATTGVAGPGPAEGKPAGTVHVAVAGPSGTATRDLRLKGARQQVRAASTEAALALAVDRLDSVSTVKRQTAAVVTGAGGTVGATDLTLGLGAPRQDATRGRTA